jgi:hypothetical protein
MTTRTQFLPYGFSYIEDGPEIGFLEDKWLENTTHPGNNIQLYTILHHKADTLAKVMDSSPSNVMLTRHLSGLGLHLGTNCYIIWLSSS